MESHQQTEGAMDYKVGDKSTAQRTYSVQLALEILKLSIPTITAEVSTDGERTE